MKDHPVVDGAVSSDDNVVSGDHMSVTRCHTAGLAIDNGFGMRVGIDMAAVAQNGAGETLQILERMKLSLARESKRWAGVPELGWRLVDQLDVVKAGTMRGIELPLELVALAAGPEKQVSVDTLEIAIDVLLRGDRLDARYRCSVAFGGNLCTGETMEFLYLVVPVIECIGEVRGSAARLAAADWPVIDYDYSPASAGQQVCGGHSGNAGAHYTHASTRITRELGQLWRITGGHPD
jgi:hypothetical protein